MLFLHTTSIFSFKILDFYDNFTHRTWFFGYAAALVHIAWEEEIEPSWLAIQEDILLGRRCLFEAEVLHVFLLIVLVARIEDGRVACDGQTLRTGHDPLQVDVALVLLPLGILGGAQV